MKSNQYNAKILLVDDSQENIEVLIRQLEKLNLSITSAATGEEALKLAKNLEPDVILLDVLMPGIDGYETCRQLKLQQRTYDVPVMFMTALDDLESKLKGFQAGAVDFITKPLNHDEVLARVNAQVAIRRQFKALEQINFELENQIEIILGQKKLLENVSKTDPLTKLNNKRDFYERIEEEHAHHKRNATQLTIAFADIDNFKTINDKYGHLCGDNVLMNSSKIMKKILRLEDYIARWGGDEFIFILRDTNIHDAGILLERIRQNISETEYEHENKDLNVSISIGACEYDTSMSIDDCIKKADEMLYKSKQEGRNKTSLYENN